MIVPMIVASLLAVSTPVEAKTCTLRTTTQFEITVETDGYWATLRRTPPGDGTIELTKTALVKLFSCVLAAQKPVAEPVPTPQPEPDPAPQPEPAPMPTLPHIEWALKPMVPLGTYPDFADYDEALVRFSKTAVNDVDPRVTQLIPYEKYATWLHDRATTLCHVAQRTGEDRWLQECLTALEFYRSHIDENGCFDLKPGWCDAKYLYGEAIYLGYQLTGDEAYKETMRRLMIRDDGTPMIYDPSRKWTERHLAVNLLRRLYGWLLLEDEQLKVELDEAITATIAMQQQSGGGFLHRVWSHSECGEGWEGSYSEGCSEQVSSPWMSALLADALYQVYLVTQDERIPKMFGPLADFMAAHALWSGTFKLADGTKVEATVPFYLAGPGLTNAQKQQSQWNNPEHCINVSSIFALAYHFTGEQKYRDTFDRLYQCQVEYTWPIWTRPNAPACCDGKGKSINRLAPPRKFNWWFRTTANLDVLIYE